MDCMRNNFVEGALLDGRFRTISPLNHGSFGMVFKALDTWTGEFVALKCLTKSTAAANCPQILAVDDRSEELAIHRYIGNHPNIVNLVSHFETDNHIYLVLEYCANGDLYEAIRIGRGPLQTEHVRDCMLQLVSAVEHMHARGIYHRDIKPENIFLSQSGAMKLGDFGLATTDAWSFESAVGSDRYMAPEQFDPSNTGYSPAKADAWALGICLLNILFSRNPFATPTLSDPLFSDFANDRQTLFDVFPNMSQDTFEVLVHCLALDPSKRSISAVRAALKRVVSFTTDDESLDEFCADDTGVVIPSANREPLRTPSLSTPQADPNGPFPWAKALAMTPPVRQLSVIPDTEFSEDLFPSSDNSSQDWFSVKPDSGSIASFVDSGLGVSLKSVKAEPQPTKVNRSKPMPISGSLPVSMARPIPSMASIFGKKRELVSKSWSDLWDEDEEAQADAENDFHMEVEPAQHPKAWPEEEDRDTPRVGLTEMKDPANVNNSRNRSPGAIRTVDNRVNEHTGFLFEEHHSTPTPTATSPKYSPPAKTGIVDRWAALGELRRGNVTPKKTPTPAPVQAEDPPRKRQHRAGSWRRNLNWTSTKPTLPSPPPTHGHGHGNYGFDFVRKDNSAIKEWSLSKDWRQHAGQPSPPHKSCNEAVREIEWVWRNDLHL
jgi:serine/threonine protein kinase